MTLLNKKVKWLTIVYPFAGNFLFFQKIMALYVCMYVKNLQL